MSWSLTIPPCRVDEFEDVLSQLFESDSGLLALEIQNPGCSEQATVVAEAAIVLVEKGIVGKGADIIGCSLGGHIQRGAGSAGPSVSISLYQREAAVSV